MGGRCYSGEKIRFALGVLAMKNISLHLENVGVTFEGKCNSQEGLKGWLANKVSGRAGSPATYKVDALKKINLEISHGERVGLFCSVTFMDDDVALITIATWPSGPNPLPHTTMSPV